MNKVDLVKEVAKVVGTKNPSKKTTSRRVLNPSLNQRPGKSPFTRDLTPSELKSLKKDKKQTSEQAKRYFQNKYKGKRP